MTTGLKSLRVISYLLIVLILCQSCNIYRKTNISLDEAAATEIKVRVKTTSDEKYVFKRIEKNEGLTYGVAGKNSKAAKELIQYRLPEDGKSNKIKINLDEIQIREINPKNKTLSEMVPLMIGGVGLLIFGLTFNIAPGF